MNKLLPVSLFISVLVFLQANSVLANSQNNAKKDQAEIESKIYKDYDEQEDEDTENDENEIKDEFNKVKTIINKHEFVIRGKISAFDANSLTVNSQLIKIDPNITKEAKREGALSVGAVVKVEGRVIKGILYAKEIKVEKSKPSTTTTPSTTPTVSLATTPSPTTETAPLTTITPTVGITNNTQSQKYILGEIIAAWEKILNLLKEIPTI